MLTIAAVVFGLGAVIFAHEAGHFLLARLARIPVARFSIGFPPRLFGFKLWGTEFVVGAIPLGGYVKMGWEGEDPPDRIGWARRLLSTAGGPIANAILAVGLLIVVLSVIGQDYSVFSNIVGPGSNSLGLAEGDTVVSVGGNPTPDFIAVSRAMQEEPGGVLVAGTAAGRIEVRYSVAREEAPGFQPFIAPVIGECFIGMPAYESGLEEGDTLISVDGVPLASWNDLVVSVTAGHEMELVYSRGGGRDTVVLSPEIVDGRAMIGATPLTAVEKVRVPLGQALSLSAAYVVEFVGTVYEGLASAFTRPREFVDQTGGPVYIAELLGQQAGFGIGRLLQTMAMISLAIMVFNLLPIPILDGGQMVLQLIEGVRGRPLSSKGQMIAQQIGVGILLALFALIMWNDLSRLFLRLVR